MKTIHWIMLVCSALLLTSSCVEGSANEEEEEEESEYTDDCEDLWEYSEDCSFDWNHDPLVEECIYELEDGDSYWECVFDDCSFDDDCDDWYDCITACEDWS